MQSAHTSIEHHPVDKTSDISKREVPIKFKTAIAIISALSSCRPRNLILALLPPIQHAGFHLTNLVMSPCVKPPKPKTFWNHSIISDKCPSSLMEPLTLLARTFDMISVHLPYSLAIVRGEMPSISSVIHISIKSTSFSVANLVSAIPGLRVLRFRILTSALRDVPSYLCSISLSSFKFLLHVLPDDDEYGLYLTSDYIIDLHSGFKDCVVRRETKVNHLWKYPFSDPRIMTIDLETLLSVYNMKASPDLLIIFIHEWACRLSVHNSMRMLGAQSDNTSTDIFTSGSRVIQSQSNTCLDSDINNVSIRNLLVLLDVSTILCQSSDAEDCQTQLSHLHHVLSDDQREFVDLIRSSVTAIHPYMYCSILGTTYDLKLKEHFPVITLPLSNSAFDRFVDESVMHQFVVRSTENSDTIDPDQERIKFELEMLSLRQHKYDD